MDPIKTATINAKRLCAILSTKAKAYLSAILPSIPRRTGASTMVALLVFLGVLLLGGILGSMIAPYIPYSLGSISIGNYNVNILGFLVTGIISFPLLIWATRTSHTEHTYE